MKIFKKIANLLNLRGLVSELLKAFEKVVAEVKDPALKKELKDIRVAFKEFLSKLDEAVKKVKE